VGYLEETGKRYDLSASFTVDRHDRSDLTVAHSR
jgi:hypothetical protein